MKKSAGGEGGEWSRFPSPCSTMLAMLAVARKRREAAAEGAVVENRPELIVVWIDFSSQQQERSLSDLATMDQTNRPKCPLQSQNAQECGLFAAGMQILFSTG